MHGQANGEIRGNAKEMDVLQAFDGDDSTYPDGPTIEEALTQLENLSGEKNPFFLYNFLEKAITLLPEFIF